MKSMIICDCDGLEWVGEYFYDISPYMIRIGNKPLLEYFVDLCTLLSIREIRIMRHPHDDAAENYFGDGAQWNSNISYGVIESGEDIGALVERHRNIFTGGDLLLVDGLFFPVYDKDHPVDLSAGNEHLALTDGRNRGFRIMRRGGVNMEFGDIKFGSDGIAGLDMKSITGIRDIYDLNMELVRGGAEKYIMPSYSNEKGVFIGRNVEIMRYTSITQPVILGSDIQLRNFSRIGPGAVIGDNTLIDSNSVVTDSVIYGDSYIGSELEINHKILYKRKLIDPDSGATLDIVDDFLVSEIQPRLVYEFFVREVHSLFAIILFIFQLPLFLLLRPFAGAPTGHLDCRAEKSTSTTLRLPYYRSDPDSWAGKLFWKFSLDKFRLIIMVLKGKLYLVGNAPMPDDQEGHSIIGELQSYHPAAFCYSEMRGHAHAERRIDEIYYSRHRGIFFDIRIIIYSLVLRVFRPTRH